MVCNPQQAGFSTRMWLIVGTFSIVLGACTSQPQPPSGSPDNPGVTPPPPAQERTLTTWTVDPTFSVDAISDPQTRAWYQQVKREIAKEAATECQPDDAVPKEEKYFPSSATTAACSAIKHYVGRALSEYVSTLLTLFRLTGDPALLAEVDRVMEIARARLRDTDGDGYRNFGYQLRYGDDDFNPKEDALAHGFLAEVAYVYQKNAAYSTAEHPYAARADAWLAYLRNDFEAKWAGRRQTAEGLPVDRLMHPFIQILRYGVYMAKLFPNEVKYRQFSEQLSEITLAEFRTDATPSGEAFVWSHVVRGWDPQVKGDPDRCLTFQMAVYPQQTMTAFVDLALEGHPGFSDLTSVQKLSRSLSESIMEPTEYAFLYKDVGGLRNGLLEPNQRKDTYIEGWCFQDAGFSNGGRTNENFRSEGSYLSIPWALLAAFAPEASANLESSKIYRVSEQLYGNPLNEQVAAKRIHVPAALAFARLYHAGSFTLAR